MSQVPGKGIPANSMVTQESWPLLRSERNWSMWALLWVSLSSGTAAWGFAIGGYVAFYLNAGMGTASMIAGSLLGMFFVVLAVVPSSVKYGIESIASSIPQLGTRGSIFSILLQYAGIMGWNCVLLIMFGNSLGEVLVTLQLIPSSMQGPVAAVGTLGAIALTWWFLKNGASTVRTASMMISIAVAAVGALILFFLVKNIGIATLFSAKPLAPSDNMHWNYVVGSEIVMATVLSWWPYAGSIVRMVPKGKDTIWPAMFGLGLPTAVISLIGLYSALVTGNPDPTKWMIEIGGAGFGIIALAFLALANIGTAIVGGYATGIGLRQIEALQKNTSWNQTTFLMLLPVACIGAFIPDLFVEKIPAFMAFLGVLFAPVIGIQIADCFFLRRHQLNVRSLFDKSKGSAYYYWGGVNLASVAAIVAGFVTYVSLLNPITYEVNSLFAYAGAATPSIILSGLVYFIFTKAIVLPANKGGYQMISQVEDEQEIKYKSQ